MNPTTSTDFSASELQTIRDALHGKIASEFEHCKAMGQTTSDDLSALDAALDHVNEAIRTTTPDDAVVTPEAPCTVPWCDLPADIAAHRWLPDGADAEWRSHRHTVGSWIVGVLEHRAHGESWFDGLSAELTLIEFTEPHDALELADELHEVARVMEEGQASVLTGFLGRAGGVA